MVFGDLEEEGFLYQRIFRAFIKGECIATVLVSLRFVVLESSNLVVLYKSLPVVC